jgi:hypothetical protein
MDITVPLVIDAVSEDVELQSCTESIRNVAFVTFSMNLLARYLPLDDLRSRKIVSSSMTVDHFLHLQNSNQRIETGALLHV